MALVRKRLPTREVQCKIFTLLQTMQICCLFVCLLMWYCFFLLGYIYHIQYVQLAWYSSSLQRIEIILMQLFASRTNVAVNVFFFFVNVPLYAANNVCPVFGEHVFSQ